VSAWDSQWNSEEMEAMWDCVSQLWVPGRSRVHGRPYLSICPITLRHSSFRYWWVCRWMPVWKRSRLEPFLSGWGHRKVGLGGGWCIREVQSNNWACLSNLFLPPPVYINIYIYLFVYGSGRPYSSSMPSSTRWHTTSWPFFMQGYGWRLQAR